MMFENLCVVIIGGTGFIGQRIIERLNILSEGKCEIRALVRDETKMKDMPNVTKIVGSLPDVPKELFPQKPNIVIHFGTKNINNDGSGFELVNVIGTKNIMESLPESTVGVIYGSSFSVYGQGSLCNVNEKKSINPETLLAISRAEAECIIMEEMRKRGKSALVLRPRFILGKDDEYTMPKLVKAYMHHINIGTGKQISTYIEADDYAKIVCELVSYILKNAQNSQYLNTAINIGYKRPVSLKELHEIFNEVFEYKWQCYIPITGRFTDFLKATGIKVFEKLGIILELGAFSHSADVTLLESIIGSGIVGKDPKTIIYNLLMDKYHIDLQI